MKKTLLAACCLPAAVLAAPQTEQTMVVTATRFSEPEASTLAPINIITREEIDRSMAQSVTDVVRLLPGLETSENGGRGQASSVLVRGGTSAQTLVLLDGVRINSVTAGGVDLNQIPLNQVERIEYIRGARASIYGADAIGGVINIITTPEQGTKQTKLSASAGSQISRDVAASTAQTVGSKGQVKFAGGFSSAAGYNVHPVAGVNDGDRDGFNAYNLMASYQQALNEQWDLNAIGRWSRYLSQSDSSYASTWGNHHEQNETWNENQSYQLGTRYRQGAYQQALQAHFSRDDMYYYNLGETRDQANSRTNVRQYDLNWLHDLQLSSDWRLGAGVDWHREELGAGSMSAGELFSADGSILSRNNTGLYSLLQYQHGPWQAEVSGRTDDNQQYGRHNTWQAGAGWTFVPNYRLSVRQGSGFRAPTFNDLYYPDPYTPGNPKVKPETAITKEISLDGVTSGVTWRATAYRSDIEEMIQWAADASGTWYPENVDAALIRGLELEGEFNTWLLTHKLSVDLKDPEDKASGNQLIRRAHTDAKWQVQGSWQKWDGSIAWRYQSQRFDDTANQVSLAGYSAWDSALSYQLTKALKLQGKVNNLFDKEYQTASGYPAEGRSYQAGFAYQM